MPRRNRPRSGSPSRALRAHALDAVVGWTHEEAATDGRWLVRTMAGAHDGRCARWPVRTMAGSAAVKTYRCPGCDQEIRPGVGHVVAWPADEHDDRIGAADRRHWHTSCWAARHRRRPTSRRWWPGA